MFKPEIIVDPALHVYPSGIQVDSDRIGHFMSKTASFTDEAIQQTRIGFDGPSTDTGSGHIGRDVDRYRISVPNIAADVPTADWEGDPELQTWLEVSEGDKLVAYTQMNLAAVLGHARIMQDLVTVRTIWSRLPGHTALTTRRAWSFARYFATQPHTAARLRGAVTYLDYRR